MRIVSWNIAHQTRERPVPAQLAKAVCSLEPDLLILNEYVHGETRENLQAQLSEAGLRHIKVSVRIGTNNQVLIASKKPIEAGELRGIPTQSGGGESNFLHVRIPEANVEVIGIRVPSYSGKALSQYWDGFRRLLGAVRTRRLVIAGDLNVDPESMKYAAAGVLRDLRDEGWQLPIPAADQWSYKTGSRIDHALLSAILPISSASYCIANGGYQFCDRNKKAMSDHAALVVDVPLN